MRSALLLAAALLTGCATAEHTAVAAHATDLTTTAIGLTLPGVAEINPLGLLIVPAKLIARQHISSAPVEQQPRLWGIFGAAGWAASANNICVIISAATGTGLGLTCPAIGIAVGAWLWPPAKL